MPLDEADGEPRTRATQNTAGLNVQGLGLIRMLAKNAPIVGVCQPWSTDIGRDAAGDKPCFQAAPKAKRRRLLGGSQSLQAKAAVVERSDGRDDIRGNEYTLGFGGEAVRAGIWIGDGGPLFIVPRDERVSGQVSSRMRPRGGVWRIGRAARARRDVSACAA